MSALLKRAVEAQTKQEKKATESADVYILNTRDPTESWARVARRAVYINRVAMELMAVDELSQLVTKHGEKAPGVKVASVGVSFEELLQRERLSMATGLSTLGKVNPQTCPHTGKIYARGNGPKTWFTCQMCGTRWPRFAGEMVLPPPQDYVRATASRRAGAQP